MVSNYFIFFVSYFLIILSTIGHGLLGIKLFKIKIPTNEIGFVGLSGVFFLILYSYISHFFFNHGYILNLILLFIGFVSLIFFKSQIIDKKNLTYIFLVFSIIFVAFIIYKTHDDFRYYHFPYSYYLNEFSMVIGVGSLNHGFKTPSSIFYLNSLFYFPYIEYHLYHISAVLIMGFSNIILISNIKKCLENNKRDHFFFLNLLAFLFINIFFYRIAEHGTDRSAQILIFIFFIYIFSLRENYKRFEIEISKLIILMSIIISLKSFYIIYLIFLIPFIYYIYNDKKFDLLKKIFQNKIFYLSTLMGLCILLVSFFNTGCLLYPIQQTCFTMVEWSIPKSEVVRLNIHYQWWSKAGGGPGYKSPVEPELYIQNFYWLKDWINRYFFTKVSDLIASLSLVSIIFIILFKTKKIISKNKFFKKNKFYYYFILLLLLEWFLYHPALRYGGYIIFSLIFFIPLSFFLSDYIVSKNFKPKVTILLLLITTIFLGRNIDRILYELSFYNANFKQNTHFFIDEGHFRIDKKLKSFSNNYDNCVQGNDRCIENKEFIIKKTYGKLIITKVRN
tara:strand:+ start:2829 stop:4514 length:1686 start_codon:yes stop_codon:yes gene_type:complete